MYRGGVISHMLDGKQYILFGAFDSLYAWSLQDGEK
jgi:hypothetical protein